MMLFLLGCAPSILDIHEFDDGEVVDTAAGEVRVYVTTEPSDEGFSTVVDAQDPEAWVALDLDAGGLEPVDDDTWDVRFRRFHISVNGGISGDGGGEAAFAEGLQLSEVDEVPELTWVTDAPDGEDEGGDPDYALHTWFLYDEETHILTPDAGVWFVRGESGTVFALRVDGYYDEFGTSGVVTFGWKGPL